MRVRAVVACAAALLLAAVSSPAALGEAGPRDLRGDGSGQAQAAGFVPFVARRGERGVYLVQLRTPSLAARIATAHRALGPTDERETVARILSSQRPAVTATSALGGEVRRNNRGHLVRDRRLHRREHRNVRSETERHRPRASDLAADLRRILRRRAVYREGTCHRLRRIGATRR